MSDLEIEIKVPLIRSDDEKEQKSTVRSMAETLEVSGWSYETTEVQRDLYLSHPSKDFSDTDEALRIRTIKDIEDGRAASYVTYKGPKMSKRSKARYEKETRIPSPADLREIFYRLGFRKVMTVEKERRIFRQDDMEASIDTVPELGCFLEIETTDTTVEKGEERILEILDDLDLDGRERSSYLELLLQK